MAYTLEKLHTVITRPSESKGAAAVWTQPGDSTISSYTSSHSNHRSWRAQNSTRSSMRRAGYTAPVGLAGVLTNSILVRAVTSASSAATSGRKCSSAARG